MIKIELSENLKSINWAEDVYLDEINFFRLLIQKQDSLQTIEASILEDNITAPFVLRGIEYSEDALEVLKNSALMQQISDKGFILKLFFGDNVQVVVQFINNWLTCCHFNVHDVFIRDVFNVFCQGT